VNRSGPGLREVACCSEPRNELSAFIKGAEFLDQLKNCSILKNCTS